ncbi:MAG TPA: hypothetical protein VGQ23_13145, partial [Burkholderiaceae bacterium]|nr:hypothetical protein [Burkholderiaceae bacterium]
MIERVGHVRILVLLTTSLCPGAFDGSADGIDGVPGTAIALIPMVPASSANSLESSMQLGMIGLGR